MVEPMTTGVIELFPFSCKSPKNEPYRCNTTKKFSIAFYVK